ncbi:sigma-70 family RNA polymerase sigma factor [Pontibacter sp. 172403-2]|uniref:RNA polymerase sigma factor n=1 Tax=Pontibacter rufus TaxID=2791028 RepID=UPI0018AF5F97|nr:sigma-70 family RNA polymerase sigma factor [Pontibacter sp. 172403-2]MBF9254603.1 sigma-70 family RNA polymerase sigma factor [Pontibacter sp. 172403-2]
MADNAKMLCNEAELWDSLRAGDEEAFSLLYTSFVDVAYSYGCRLHPDKDQVKDCIQDLFVTIWRTRNKLGPTTSIKYYLFRSLRRELGRQQKHNKVYQGATSDVLAEESAEAQWISLDEDTQRNTALENALQQLSERQREAVYLRFYQNMEFEEVALLMEISPRAVYKLIYRAIDVLKKSYFTAPLSDVSPLYVSYSPLQAGILLFVILISC